MKRILIVALVMLAAAGAFAATTAQHLINLNVVAFCAIELDPDTSTITMTPQTPADAGDPPADDTNTTKHLWYTVIRTGPLTSKITVEWRATDAAPSGCALTVQATNMGGFGNSAGLVTFVNLNSTPQDFITGIPSCYTTRVANAGPRIDYTLDVQVPGNLTVGDNHQVQITYTISAT